jgi:hypothetical protein
MGIDGRLLVGDAIWVNSTYLPEEIKKGIEYLLDKYSDLIEYNRMSGPDEKMELIFWEKEPQCLFPETPGDRRPLIISRQGQVELMRPTPDGPDLNSEEVWAPSYVDFTVQLNDYSGHQEEVRARIIHSILLREYELEDGEKVPLTLGEKQFLFQLLCSQPYTLVGKFLVYIAD